ncbi:MAG: ISAzo13 family transposase, partial [Chromatiaceae bacterium]|nr:ISAzo13 family transposase [Chromatiaceae bacterium]
GLRVRIAHYPPYTSKWNPIEHRLFSQVERAWSGVMLDSPETALKTVANAPTPFATSKIDSFVMMTFSGSGTTSSMRMEFLDKSFNLFLNRY